VTLDSPRSPEALPLLFPLGHFYSPMYDPGELASRRAAIWPARPRPTLDIDWSEEAQLELCTGVFAAQKPLVLRRSPSADPTEYWCGNDQFPPLDAWSLAAMLRYLRPARMIEIGSGYSSLITARLNREEFGSSLYFVCIEPYPRDFLGKGVGGISELRVELIQDTPLDLFADLGENDVLFIDTSHTVKTGGDVTWIFHEIIPRLQVGVVVHVHDFFLPEEYPESWVMEGRGWNETYLVRSFLSYNTSFVLRWATRYMALNHSAAVADAFQIGADDPLIGASLWFQRVR
jgi:predicted O-methyltransferase YrrM